MKLTDYIKGLRKGKNARRIELEAMKDPFLEEALEGFDMVDDQHIDRINILKGQIKSKARNKRNYALGWSIAASLLIGIGITSYFLLHEGNLTSHQNVVTIVKDTVKQPVAVLPVKSEPEITKKPPVATPIIVKPSPEATPQQLQTDEALEYEISQEQAIAAAMEIPDEDILLRDTLPDVEIKGYTTMKKSILTGAVSHVKPSSPLAKGKVTDERGEPIIGASIRLDNTDKGTLTDLSGEFKLQANGARNLQIDYIGYKSMKIPIDTANPMLIAMNEDNRTLDEVVVTGYGTAKKLKAKTPKPIFGKKSFNKYIEENINYPTDSICGQVKGKVILNFYINEQGRPEDIRIKESLCTTADYEAIRLIKEGPDWTIGEEEVTFTIRFK